MRARQFEFIDADGMRLVDATEKRIFWWTIYGAVDRRFNYVVDVEFQLRVGVFNGIGDVVDEYDRQAKCSKDQRNRLAGWLKRRSEFFNERILLSL